mgnify:CR=1 FL=1
MQVYREAQRHKQAERLTAIMGLDQKRGKER